MMTDTPPKKTTARRKKASPSRPAAKTGRPKGARNLPYVIVDHQPPACPGCGSSKLVRKPGAIIQRRPCTGTLAGRPITATERIPSICGDCGAPVMVRLLYGDPADAKKG